MSDAEPGCVFCQKIAFATVEYGYDLATPGVYTFEPLNPVVPGHRLFIPKHHVATASDDPYITGRVFAAAAEYAASQRAHYNLIVNGGAHAGQTVFHLHVHYVPRVPGDGLLLPWGGVHE